MSALAQCKTIVWFSNWIYNPYQKLLVSQLRTSHTQIIEKSHVDLIEGPFCWEADALHIQGNPFGGMQFFITYAVCFLKLLVFRSKKGKIIWTPHDIKNSSNRHWFHPISSWIQKFFLAQIASVIQAHSNNERKKITAYLLASDKKIIVIRHGSYIGYYKNTISRQDARERLQLSEDAFVLLFVGWIRNDKNIMPIVEAVKKCSVQSVLLIAGDTNSQVQKTALLQEAALHKNIKPYIERIPDDDMQLYLNACDVVMVPYMKTMTTSGSALLAMSFGKPCIATECANLVEDLDPEGNFFISEPTEVSIRQAIEAAYEKRTLLPEMGKKNLEKIRFQTWDVMAQSICRLYE